VAVKVESFLELKIKRVFNIEQVLVSKRGSANSFVPKVQASQPVKHSTRTSSGFQEWKRELVRAKSLNFTANHAFDQNKFWFSREEARTCRAKSSSFTASQVFDQNKFWFPAQEARTCSCQGFKLHSQSSIRPEQVLVSSTGGANLFVPKV